MEPNEVLKKAWEAVQASGVPESMQEAAFREAVALLRDESDGPSDGPGTRRQASRIPKASTSPRPSSKRTRSEPAKTVIEVPDEASFFAHLANEAGVDEIKLRDVLKLGTDGTVNVTPPTRMLGASKAEQARTVVALVAPARGIGLNEKPIDAAAVRAECERKHCFDSNNFGGKVIGALDGINYGGSRAEMVLASKWVSEFEAAVTRALGRPDDSETKD